MSGDYFDPVAEGERYGQAPAPTAPVTLGTTSVSLLDHPAGAIDLVGVPCTLPIRPAHSSSERPARPTAGRRSRR